jgi:D-alanine-D-alanine ligase
MDKYKTAQYLKAHGFEVPTQLYITAQEWHSHKATVLENIKATMHPPYIVKPHDDGCSIMIQKIKKLSAVSAAIDHIFKNQKNGVLIEEWISGMELTVGVIGNDNPQGLPPSHAIASGDILSLEEKFLPGTGENQTPAPLPANTILFVQRTMEQIYSAIGLKGYARIDCFYQTAEQSPTGKERIITLEINSLPALTPATCLFHQAAEINLKPMDFIDRIVELGFQAHTKQYTASAPLLRNQSAHANI